MQEYEQNGATEQQPRAERTSKSLLNMPVLCISDGQMAGLIKQILIDVKSKSVQGFLVERRRFSRDERILPFSAVAGFGEDTVTVEKPSLLERKGQSYQYVRALRRPLPLLGSRVFTAGGRTLGKVEEYRISLEDGAICGLEIAGNGFFKTRTLVDGAYIIALAAHTIMVKDEAIAQAEALENPFLSNMETAADAMRDAAVAIKENAKEAGKKLAGNFNEAVDKLRSNEPPADNGLLEIEEEAPPPAEPAAIEEEIVEEEAVIEPPTQQDEENPR